MTSEQENKPGGERTNDDSVVGDQEWPLAYSPFARLQLGVGGYNFFHHMIFTQEILLGKSCITERQWKSFTASH
jgi:hypothetical protein